MPADFVIDDLALPGPKVTWDEVSDDVAVPDMWCRALDYNALREAANSLRSFVKTGLAPGVYTLATMTVGPNGNITGIAAGSGLTDGDKGDVVVSGTGAVFTIDTAVVTPAKMSNASANSLLGNNTGAPAVPAYLSASQVRTLLGLAAVATTGAAANISGLAAVATSGSAADLGAGTLPAARMPALTGDVTTVAGAVAATIAANAVTYAKIQNVSASSRMLGRITAGAGVIEEMTQAQILTFLGLGTQLAGAGYFGDGSDGAVNFDGSSAVTGWTRSGTTYAPSARPSWYFTTCTIAGGVTLCMEVGGEGTGGGCSSELYANVGIVVPSGTATIKHNGATPTTNVQATNMTTGHLGGATGQGAGGIQNAGQNPSNFAGNWYNSRKAGAGGFGGASTTAAASTAGSTTITTLPDSAGLPCTWEQAKLHRLGTGNSGIASGGGGGGSGAGTVTIASGGAGGNGGGLITVGARNVTGNLAIEAKGGNGAPGVSAVGSNTGGGSGGGGGEIAFGCGTSAVPAGVTFNKSGGTGGAPQGGGSAGGNGVAGQQMSYPLGPS